MSNTKDVIEKAAHQDGDIHPNGKYVWVAAANGGKGDWRVIKKKPGSTSVPAPSGGTGVKPTPSSPSPSQGSASQPKKKLEDMTPDEIKDYAEAASTSALEAAVNDKKMHKDIRQIAFNVLKTRSDYDRSKVDSSDLAGGHVAKPTAKVTYTTKKPEVEIDLPDTWTVRVTGKNGMLENRTASASGLRKLYAGKTDDELLKILNNPNGRWQNRQIAYDEAAARGIDEDKIDVSGKLQKEWDAQKRRHDFQEAAKAGYNEDEADAVNVDFKGLDHEAFMREFPEGDLGWLNRDDPRVQKQFNNFRTIKDRQQYDALKTYYEPTTPGYLNPDNKIGQLNEQYDNLIKYDTTPLFISAGGAGAGKTFGWTTIAEENNLKRLEEGDSPQDADWGYVMLSDPEDDKEFRQMLHKYNGTYVDDNGEEHPRILVFDDADKILTSRSAPIKALMKKITDNNPKNRIFTDPESGQNEVFKGALLIMTNKDVAAISNSNEDAKAILSRGITNDMTFTRAENMELINKRYKTMNLGSYQKAFEKQFPSRAKQEEVRQIARDWLEENMNEADPAKFTPRTFIQLMSLIGPIFAKGDKAKARMINGAVQVGTNVPWQTQALKLIKAADYSVLEGGEETPGMTISKAVSDSEEFSLSKAEEILLGDIISKGDTSRSARLARAADDGPDYESEMSEIEEAENLLLY